MQYKINLSYVKTFNKHREKKFFHSMSEQLFMVL